MPRAVDPRFGDDGYGLDALPQFRFRKQEVEPLMKYLGEQPAVSLNELARLLSAVGMQYRRGAGRGALAISRESGGAALAYTLKQPMITCADIQVLNERALDAVINALLQMKGLWQEDHSVVEMLFAGQIEPSILRVACKEAHAKLKGTRGRDCNVAQMHCAAQLCELYETMTGKVITLSNKDGRIYVQQPHSDGARFVADAFALIVARADETGRQRLAPTANGYIASWIKHRPLRTAVHIPRT